MSPATIALLTTLASYVPYVISGAAALAAAFPKAKPGTGWAVVRGVLDTLAFNFGNAKNAPQTPPGYVPPPGR